LRGNANADTDANGYAGADRHANTDGNAIADGDELPHGDQHTVAADLASAARPSACGQLAPR
jgi:hypothetical protein